MFRIEKIDALRVLNLEAGTPLRKASYRNAFVRERQTLLMNLGGQNVCLSYRLSRLIIRSKLAFAASERQVASCRWLATNICLLLVIETRNCMRISREISSLRQQVIDTLRDAILDGRFPPGSRMVERELCELLDVSRPVLREAMQHLQAEGLLTTILHKGPTVASISAEEAKDIYQVRQSLEALAGAGFARLATAEQIRDLRAALDFLRTPEASATSASLLAAKNRFYRILLEGCGNQVAGQVLTQLNNRITMLRKISLGRVGRLAETLAELEAVVCAIEARDAELASALCSDHVAKAAAVIAAHFASQQAKPPAPSAIEASLV